MTETPQARYSIEHLVNLVALHNHLLGDKPKTLTLSPDFYTWYVQSVAQLCETYNLSPGFKDGKVMFNGVELLKKVKIETV